MKNYYYIFLGFIILLSSCKKEEIPELNPTSGSHGIYINGMLGTEPINLNSSGNYYMYSNFIFDSIREVYIFTGELKERYCTDCGPSIKLNVTNYKKSPGGINNFDYDSIFNTSVINWGNVTTDELGLAELVIEKNNGSNPMSSMNTYQPTANSLKIKDFELYKVNELGQNTVKVKFEGQVTMLTPSGEKLFVFDGAFAFAFP